MPEDQVNGILTLEQFASALSHDIPAPLRIVVEFSKLLSEQYADKPLDARGKQYLSYILENGTQAQSMLQRLVTYIRMDTTPANITHVSASALINACMIQSPRLMAMRDSIVIDAPCDILVDEGLFSQAITELLLNAATFHHVGSAAKVHVSCKKTEQGVAFTLEDNGIGMTPECARQCFELFYRYHPEAMFPGLGMGLAIARKAICLHKGTLSIERSGEGEGTTVAILIPDNL